MMSYPTPRVWDVEPPNVAISAAALTRVGANA